MKRFVLTVITLVLASLSLFAQKEGAWIVEASLTNPLYDRYVFPNPFTKQYQRNAEILASGNKTAVYTYDGKTMEYKSNAKVLPTFTLSIGRRISGAPVSVHFGIGISHAYNTLNGGPAPLYEQETIWHFLPEARFYYTENGKFSLYGAVAAGLRAKFYSETLEGDSITAADYRFSYQIVPIGISFGEQWRLNLAFGLGREWAPVAVSAGYCF